MTLESLPEEIISLILQSCGSFSQLRCLILCCKTTHDVWMSNQRTILWAVGQTAIPGFSDALIAVRATNISKKYILRGELPPDPFPVSTLPGTSSKPELEEIKQVRSFTHLARYLETHTRSPHDKRPDFLPHRWYFESLSWEPEVWDEWREGYHRAIYQYLTAGAVLCRAYYEPILSSARPRGFLSSLVGLLAGVFVSRSQGGGDEDGDGDTQEDDGYPTWFSKEEQRYLQTVPIYDSHQHDSDAWERAFKPLEEIFLAESRKQACPRQNSTTSTQHSTSNPKDSKKAIYHTFGSRSKNPHSLSPAHAETLFHQILQFLHLIDGDIRYQISLPGDTPAENTSDPLSHSLSCFLFGSFTLMDIRIRQYPTSPTASASASAFAYAFATPTLPILTPETLPNAPSKEYLSFGNMHNYLKKVHDISGLANCYGNNPIRKTPPPASFFVEYMLRRYFGLRFSEAMFDSTVEGRCAWCAFHQFGGVFLDDGNGVGETGYVGGDLLERVDGERSLAVFREDAWYY
ncbi:hypothetical protein BJX70DRAFT_406129 [Aspergillus crustosus]